MNRAPSLKATPSSWIAQMGSLPATGIVLPFPWVMHPTSLPLSALHYPRLLKWPPFGRLCVGAVALNSHHSICVLKWLKKCCQN